MDTSVSAPSVASDQTIATVLQAASAPIVAPLTAAIDGYRQANERHVEQLVSQAEQIGRLRAELAVRGASQTPTVRRQPQSALRPHRGVWGLSGAAR
jgi:hypothetical protein